MNKKVSAIVINWNGMAFIKECLESLQKQIYNNIRVIFIDNGSTDDSVEYSKQNFPWADLILFNTNQGFEIPNNIAIQKALADGADYILLLNNDLVLAPNAVSELVAAGERDPTVGALGPVQVRYDNPAKVISAGGYYDWMRGMVVQNEDLPSLNNEVDFLSGAALMVKKVVLEQVGMLDEDYYFYGEDVDFCKRIKQNGYKLLCVASSIVRHHVGGSRSDSSFHIYHITRSRFILMKRYAPLYNWLYFLPFFIKNSICGEVWWYLRNNRNNEAKAMMKAVMDSFSNHIRLEFLQPLTMSRSHKDGKQSS